jgi:hypothetical protein
VPKGRHVVYRPYEASKVGGVDFESVLPVGGVCHFGRDLVAGVRLDSRVVLKH